MPIAVRGTACRSSTLLWALVVYHACEAFSWDARELHKLSRKSMCASKIAKQALERHAKHKPTIIGP